MAPFNSTLRALEQEKSQTLSLSGMLAEACTAYETLRTEFYQVDRKATALEAEVEKLREDLELSRETNRGLESARLELTDDLNAPRAHAAELDRQLSHETTQRRALGEARRTLQHQFDAAEKRIMQLEGELAAAREKLTLLDDEKRSLQIAIDQTLNETARLTWRLTESENTLTATRAQLGKVEASFAEAYAERGRLGAALDEAKEQHLAERNSLNMRLDALQSRAATAERLLSEARQNLIVRTEEVRAFDRKSVEATIARNNAEKRLAQIEAQHEARERQIRDHEQARTALGAHRAQRPSGSGHPDQPHQHREARRGSQFGAAARTHGAGRGRGRALGAARKDNSRLQSEVAALRSTLRRGAPLDDAPVPPAEAANDEAPSKGKRVKGAEGP